MIVPAILTDSPSELERKLSECEKLAAIEAVHIDVLDGEFTQKNNPFPTVHPSEFPDLSAYHFEAEVHLMVNVPTEYLEACRDRGIARVYVHAECPENWNVIARSVRSLGLEFGLAISPTTDLESIAVKANDVDVLLVLGVTPGKQGQSMAPGTPERIRAAQILYPHLEIATDGGVRAKLVAELTAAGAQRIVVGSAMWSGDLATAFGSFAH